MEYEQGGADRAQLYGKALIDRLATALSGKGPRGISPTNLRKFRAFYEAYPGIRQTLSVESGARATLPDIQPTLSVVSGVRPSLPRALVEALTSHFKLGWSHYVALLTQGPRLQQTEIAPLGEDVLRDSSCGGLGPAR